MRSTSDSVLVNSIAMMKNRAAAKGYSDAKTQQAEVKIMLHDLNRWLYLGMQSRDSSLALPYEILLTVAAIGEFDTMLRPFQKHEAEIAALCSADPEQWE